MAKKRVHILTAVNASAVSKDGGKYTIKGVCGAVNDIVMNGMLYPADQLAKGAATLNGKPAPAGHPKNAAGQYISALNGEALLSAYIGSICTNARHEGGRTLVDIVVNEAQARAHPDGLKLVERLDAAIAGNNADPIHVSTGLFVEAISANGESLGKKYDRIATNLQYDHLAILLNSRGAGTPEQGVGMFLNSDGSEDEVEAVTVNADPEDRRNEGLLASAKALIRRLLGNGTSDVSFDQITSALYGLLPDGAWLQEVFDRYAVWRDQDGKLYRQDYSVSSEGSVAWSSNPVEVARRVEYQPITNREDDPVKETIIAALNAAGISGVAAMTDAQLLNAYEALKAQPHIAALNEATQKLTAANAKIAEQELAANAAKDAELTALATELAANTSLKPEDFKAMGLERCRELKAAAKKAAPVLPGMQGNSAGDDLDYDINALGKEV
jgi:hypothetical protein